MAHSFKTSGSDRFDSLLGCWVFVVWLFVLLDLFAEICAGSLASGCEFSKHLFVPKQKMVVIFVVPQTVILEA